MRPYRRVFAAMLFAVMIITAILSYVQQSWAKSTDSTFRTLILTNQAQLNALYGPTATASLLAGLGQLAAHPSVSGTIIFLDADPTVAAAYADWQTQLTSTIKANAVATAIHSLILTQTASHPQLEYVVLVGDDRVIPFRRLPDPTPRTDYLEKDYLGLLRTTTVGAALADNMMLSDDYYGDLDGPISDTLYLPELAVGRLVETPAEMLAVIDVFLFHDVRNTQRGLVAGYDFVQDAAQETCSTLQQDLITADCDLIGNTWTSTDLVNSLQSGDWDVAFLYTHADHTRLGAPGGGMISTAQILSWTNPLSGVLIYSLGPHGGLNVPPETPRPIDWPQAWLSHGAMYVANTGYSWGLFGNIGLSEQLGVLFAKQLVMGQSVAVGQALTTTKRIYFDSATSWSGYDQKVVAEMTFYGLPMYRIDTSGKDTYEPDDTCAQAQPIATTGVAQHHTFHTVGDTDWISFTAQAGQTYWIRATPSPSSTIVGLTLNDSCSAMRPVSQPITGQNFIKLTVSSTGVYYLKTTAGTAAAYGSQTGYDLSVAVERRLYLPLVAHNASMTATLPANLPTIEAIYPLTDLARARLQQNSMVILSTPITDPLSLVYTGIADADDLSVFITTDALLYVYHSVVNELLKTVEQQTLYTGTLTLVQELQTDSLNLYATLPVTQVMARAGARHNLVVLSVARLLLEPDWSPPITVQSEILSYTQKITEHTVTEFYPGDDYTQYLPRGHYAGDPQLERYFRAMKWLGRRIYRIQDNASPADADIELVAAVILGQMLQDNPTAQTTWCKVYDITRQLIGEADSITPPLVTTAISRTFGVSFTLAMLESPGNRDLLRQELMTNSDYPTSEIIPVPSSPGQIPSRYVQIMGERYLPDSEVMQKTVFTYTSRLLPSGLDVMAALMGSNRADALLAEEKVQDPAFATQLTALRAQFGGYTATWWTRSIHNSWLYSLKPLFAAYDANYPRFMQSAIWERKALNTALASWSHLRHDFILYGKQSGASLGGSSGYGYVEPVPEFYTRLSNASQQISSTLAAYDALPQSYAIALSALSIQLNTFGDYARKIVAHQPLTENEQNDIHEFGHWLESFYLSMKETTPLSVADVAFDPNTHNVLHEGVGAFNPIIIIYEQPAGQPLAGLGYVMSYYEFALPNWTRLTDAEWQTQIISGTPPARPWWMVEILEP